MNGPTWIHTTLTICWFFSLSVVPGAHECIPNWWRRGRTGVWLKLPHCWKALIWGAIVLATRLLTPTKLVSCNQLPALPRLSSQEAIKVGLDLTLGWPLAPANLSFGRVTEWCHCRAKFISSDSSKWPKHGYMHPHIHLLTCPNPRPQLLLTSFSVVIILPGGLQLTTVVS